MTRGSSPGTLSVTLAEDSALPRNTPPAPRKPTAYIRWGKRLFDAVAAAFGLLVTFPLLLICAVAVRLDSRGPIFFRQRRVGRGHKPFDIIKFRTMIPHAEENGLRITADGDSRITTVGKWLRKTKLDELPQLFNVLKGEMSFVGPRPERPPFVASLQQQIPFYSARLLAKPGITGWAQVMYHYGSSEEDALVKLQYDLYYVKHQSVYLDLLIILKTVGTVLRCQGT